MSFQTVSYGTVFYSQLSDFASNLFGLPAPGNLPSPAHIQRLYMYIAQTKSASPAVTESVLSGKFTCVMSHTLMSSATGGVTHTATGCGDTKAAARQQAALILLRLLSGVNAAVDGRRYGDNSLEAMEALVFAAVGPIRYSEWRTSLTNAPDTWVCCLCETRNGLDPVCSFCQTDVSDHVSKGVFLDPSPRQMGRIEVIPRFGDKAPRKTKGVPRKVKAEVKKEVKREVRKEVVHRPKAARLERKVRPHGEGSSAVAAVLAAMMDPKNNRPVRINDTWQSKLTTTANPFEISDAPYPGNNAPASGGAYFPQDQSFQVFRKSVTCASIQYLPLDSQAGVYGVFLDQEPVSGQRAGTTPPKYAAAIVPASPEISWLPVAYAMSVSGGAPHGTYWAYGGSSEAEDAGWFLLQTGDTITLNVSSGAWADGTGNFELWRYVPGQQGMVRMANTAITASGDTGTLQISGFGYYAVKFSHTYNIMTLMTLAINLASGPRFAVNTAPSFPNFVNSIVASRVIGQAVLFQNTASPLNRNGEISMYQIMPGEFWMDFTLSGQPAVAPAFPSRANSYGYDKVSANAQAYNGQAEKGGYVWAKPVSQDWLQWRKEVTVRDGVIYDLNFDLDYQWPDVIIATNVDPAGQQARVVHTMAIEWETTDTSRPLGKAQGSSLQTVMLQDVVRMAPQYSENPKHLAMLHAAMLAGGRFLRDAAIAAPGTLAKWAPVAAQGAKLASFFL